MNKLTRAACFALAFILTASVCASSQAQSLWNINFAGNGVDAISVPDGLVLNAPATGADQWNNLIAPDVSWDPASPLAINDSNGANPIGLDWTGQFIDHSQDLGNTAITDLNNSYFGHGDFDSTLDVTGLDNNKTYDVYVYFTWNWNENDVNYTITEGTGADLDLTLTPQIATADAHTNYVDGSDGAPGNFVKFQSISPVSGSIDINAQSADGGFNAIQIVEVVPNSKLSVAVNTVTGETVLSNPTSEPISLDYYLLNSAAGALDEASWTSLDSQGIDEMVTASADLNDDGSVNGDDLAIWSTGYGVNESGDIDGDSDTDGSDFLSWQRQFGETPGTGDGWTEAGGSDENELAELFLDGQSTLLPGEELSLGNAFDPSQFGSGQEGDLLFSYAVAGQSALTLGDITYVTSLSAVASVPEPTTAWLASLAMGSVLCFRRRFCWRQC